MPSGKCGKCGCLRDRHGLGTCPCGCPRFILTSGRQETWFVVVREPNTVKAIGPIARWLDARRIAQTADDPTRGVRTKVVDERPTNMRVLDLDVFRSTTNIVRRFP